MNRRSRRFHAEPESSGEENTDFSWGQAVEKPKNVAIHTPIRFYGDFTWRNEKYKIGNFVFILSDDENRPYVARLDELCDISDLRRDYNYQAKVSWFMQLNELREAGINDIENIRENEVVQLNPTNRKAPSRDVDIETIRGKCAVLMNPSPKSINKTKLDGVPLFICRYVLSNSKLKALAGGDGEPKTPKSKTPAKPLTVNGEDGARHTATKLQVSPLKLKRVGGKENCYTPQKTTTTRLKQPDTVEKLSGNLTRVSLEPGTPSQRKTPKTPRNILATPKSAPRVVEETLRSGRKVRRSIFPEDKEEKSEKDEIVDEDLVSESDAEVSSESESSSSDATEIESEDDSFVRRPKRTPGKKSQGARTPKRAVSIKSSARTPSMPVRRVKTREPKTDLEHVLEKLHVSAVPDQLSCRETQFAEIYSFVEGHLTDQVGACMYISGVPGTGKTATVREVVTALHEARETDDVPDFQYIEINGMKLSEPHQAYVQILKQLTGKKASPESASDTLTEMFKGKRKSSEKMVVLLVDELDLLWTRKQQVLYNIFDWPTHPNSRLVVVAIANTMDLPERMVMNKVASRMGLCRMTFQPYTFQELQEIVRTRLSGLELIDPDAIQFISRKVAALSGDARRALDVCRRAVELSEHSNVTHSPSKKQKKYQVTMAHVNSAIQEMFSSTKIVAIQALSEHEKLVLRAIVAEFRRTGVEECVFYNVDSQYRTIARLEGFVPLSSSVVSRMLMRLASLRLLMLSDSHTDFRQKICLNATTDDVNFALKERAEDD